MSHNTITCDNDHKSVHEFTRHGPSQSAARPINTIISQSVLSLLKITTTFLAYTADAKLMRLFRRPVVCRDPSILLMNLTFMTSGL